MSGNLPSIYFLKFYGFMSWVQILIHFDLIFVYGIREWSSFILSHVIVQFSQHYYWMF